MRLDGAEFHDIVRYAAEQGWNVRERQLWNYIRAADELLVGRLEKDRDKLLARHVAQRRALYAQAGVAKQFAGRFYDVPHRFTRAMQDEAFAWLDQHLAHQPR
jgi:hypothetical protein